MSESRVRMSEVAVLIKALTETFDAGVRAATPGAMPEQYMLTSGQILEEQAKMAAEAAWICGGDDDEEPPEDD